MPDVLRHGEIVRIREQRWRVARYQQHDAVAIVDVSGCDPSNRGVRTRFLLPFEVVDRLPALRATRVVRRGRWRHLTRQVLAGAVPRFDSLRVLAGAAIDLLPFQLEPALAAVGGLAARILIADDVGLGKTIQAGLIVAETLERDSDAHVLVVCPAALRPQWCDELATRFRLSPEVFDSSSLARLGTVLAGGANPWAAERLVVTSVDYVKRPDVLRALEAVIWDLVVVDEAHNLAGASDRHAAAALLSRRARAFVMLTATPHSGDDETFERLCRLGDIDRRFPLALFRRRRQDVALAATRRTVWRRVRLDAAEIAMHDALVRYARRVWSEAGAGARLAMVVLVRRAASSAEALARSIERRLVLLAAPRATDVPAAEPAGRQPGLPFDTAGEDDEEPDARLAAAGLADRADERRQLESILRLARSAAGRESKLRVIRTLLRRTSEPAIIFTEYRDTLAILARELGVHGCEILHGGLADDERRRALERFTAGTTRLLLATDAAGEGLNLQARCRLVVHLELPWTPVRVEQRVGRVDRIGQSRPAHQVLLVAAGTAEETTVAPRLRLRSARSAHAFDAMRQPAEECIVAEDILGTGRLLPGEPPVAAIPPDVHAPDLRARAQEEAGRARTARALMPVGVQPPPRPFAAAMARRSSRGCWVFRASLGPSCEDIIWETLVGATFVLEPRRLAAAADAAAFFDIIRGSGQAAVERAVRQLLGRDLDRLHAAMTAALGRERAVALELERRHARLAATLIQRGLFDRRLERDGASQRQVLAEAVTVCRRRLARLERATACTVAVIEPAFAVLLP